MFDFWGGKKKPGPEKYNTHGNTTQSEENIIPSEHKVCLDKLSEGDRVAVVTLLGSLCPITSCHVRAFVEAKKMLEPCNAMCDITRSEKASGLPDFDTVLGYISLNSDRYVGQKMLEKGDPTLTLHQRQLLVDLGTQDHGSWLACDRHSGNVVQYLRENWPHVDFVRFIMNGADDVLNYKKWEMCRDSSYTRLITMGRPGFTEGVRDGMREIGINPDTHPNGNEFFILGPELPSVSSSAVRNALQTGHIQVLKDGNMLHPSVLKWCLEHPDSPYRTDSGSDQIREKVKEAQTTPVQVTVQRPDSISSTMLRKKADKARTADVWVDSHVCVRNGTVVMKVREEGDFSWVRLECGEEGFVQTLYLHDA